MKRPKIGCLVALFAASVFEPQRFTEKNVLASSVFLRVLCGKSIQAFFLRASIHGGLRDMPRMTQISKLFARKYFPRTTKCANSRECPELA